MRNLYKHIGSAFMAALLPLTAAAQSPLESGHSIMVGDDTYDMTDIYEIAFVDKATLGSTPQATAPSVVKLLKHPICAFGPNCSMPQVGGLR